MATRQSARLPLIAIIGATGTGKSNLAVALAQKFNGEVINGDALQLYRGLPIVTNKITPQDQRGIPHHLLGCIDVDEPPWTVGPFVRAAEQSIRQIRSRGRLPIVVGGTLYYIQSLLFAGGLVDGLDQQSGLPSQAEAEWPILTESNDRILEELRKVDPQMAQRWHPKDRRRIQRSLEIYLQTGRKASDIYRQQREGETGTSGIAEGLGSDDTDAAPAQRQPRDDFLVFWLNSDASYLEERLRRRVDAMVTMGLLDEIKDMEATYRALLQRGVSVDLTRGIWPAIGFKEFVQNIGTSQHEKTARWESEAIERTKIATRRYSRRQVQWIKNTLMPELSASNTENRLISLDVTESDEDQQGVMAKAFDATTAFLRGDANIIDSRLFGDRASQKDSSRHDRFAQPCDTCGIVSMTPRERELHLRSRRHKSRKARSSTALGPEDRKTPPSIHSASSSDFISGGYGTVALGEHETQVSSQAA